MPVQVLPVCLQMHTDTCRTCCKTASNMLLVSPDCLLVRHARMHFAWYFQAEHLQAILALGNRVKTTGSKCNPVVTWCTPDKQTYTAHSSRSWWYQFINEPSRFNCQKRALHECRVRTRPVAVELSLAVGVHLLSTYLGACRQASSAPRRGQPPCPHTCGRCQMHCEKQGT